MKTSYLLTPWQKKQAALLYYFSSMDYLKGLKERIHAIRLFAEGELYQNRSVGRDKFLRSSQWGDRNTGENWANNAWPFLADFQASVARDIADRASQIYHITGTNQCGRGMSEFSMQWMPPAEQERFDAMFEELSLYAGNIDDTMDKTYHISRWDDFGLTLEWQKHADHFPVLPKFQVLTDISGESGRIPPRTGVYVAIDDPDASLQFAWTGSTTGRLLDCATFNDLGKAALATIGRPRLWVDGKAMLDFVHANASNPAIKADPFFDGSSTEDLAPSLIARNAFGSHPSRWYYVELVSDEFEPVETEIEQYRLENLRFDSGTLCQKPGFYFTPAHLDSRRRFELGEIFPDLDSKYGKTIWQWEVNQN